MRQDNHCLTLRVRQFLVLINFRAKEIHRTRVRFKFPLWILTNGCVFQLHLYHHEMVIVRFSPEREILAIKLSEHHSQQVFGQRSDIIDRMLH